MRQSKSADRHKIKSLLLFPEWTDQPQVNATEASEFDVDDDSLKAYYTSALSNLERLDHDLVKTVGQAVFDACKRHGIWCFLPHAYNDPRENPTASPAEVYCDDRRHTNESHLLIAFTDFASWGGGEEIEMASQALAPVLLVGRSDRNTGPVSRMVKGAPTVQMDKTLAFDDIADLARQLDNILPELRPLMEAHRTRLDELNQMDLGGRLRSLLESEKINSVELAEMIGVAPAYTEFLLQESTSTAAANPSLGVLKSIADSLMVRVGFLIGAEDHRLSEELRIQVISEEADVPPEYLQALVARGRGKQSVPVPVRHFRNLAERASRRN